MSTVVVTPTTQSVVIDGAGSVVVTPSNPQVVIDGAGTVQVQPVSQTVALGNPRTVTVETQAVQVVSAGSQGPQGIQGTQGAAGQGVPAGGGIGQALVKATVADYDTQWATITAGVSSFNGRGGAVTPQQADYDPFFLTPAEGNATYQPLDADLTAIAGLTGTGFAVRTGTNTWALKNVVPPLPVPLVKLSKVSSIGPSDDTRSGAETSQNLTLLRTPFVVASGVPEELFDPAYGLKLELMRYVKHGSKERPKRGYVHPSHSTPSGNGSLTHGGSQNGGLDNGVSNSPRPTEWNITSRNQRVDMTQLHGWFTLRELEYRNTAGSRVPFICPTPSFVGFYRARRFNSYAYSNGYQPQYFAWRYSIIDPTDERGKRITGPMSPVIAVGTKEFLFRPGAIIGNFKTAVLKGGTSYTSLNAWFARRD